MNIMKARWTAHRAWVAESLRNSTGAAVATLASPVHSVIHSTNPAVRIALAAVLIMSMACTPRQDTAEYHYVSPDDEQAVVFMAGDDQSEAAVLALKGMMNGVHGTDTTDSYAEASDPASVGTIMPAGFGAPIEAPIEEPVETVVAVVVPDQATVIIPKNAPMSLSVAAGASTGESREQLVSAMNVIAKMASGTSVASTNTSETLPTPVTPVSTDASGSYQPTPTPTAIPTKVSEDINVELARALEEIAKAPTLTPEPSVTPAAKNNGSGTSKKEQRKSQKPKNFTTDETAGDSISTPTPAPTAVPMAEPTPESTVNGKDKSKKEKK